MNYVLTKCNEIDDQFCNLVILLKRNIKLKANLTKKQVRFTSEASRKTKYIFIQSNCIPVIYGVSEYCGMKFIDFASDCGILVKSMETLQNEIINKYCDLFKGLIFSNNIGRNTVRFRYTTETKVFSGDSIFRGKLTSGSLVKIIACPREVWITGEKFGFNWDIIQILIVESGDLIVDKNLFTNEYEKYIKMMRTGVPEGAVKLKMDLDGVDSNIDLKKLMKETPVSHGNIPPPPPPPMISGSGGIPGKTTGMAGVFADIKKGSKLRKISDKDRNTVKKEKTGFGGKISLKDILKARGKLNKTGTFL